MAKKSRMSVLKRQREVRKAEKAALKRDRREQRKSEGPHEPTADDFAGYGTEDEEPEVTEQGEQSSTP